MVRDTQVPTGGVMAGSPNDVEVPDIVIVEAQAIYSPRQSAVMMANALQRLAKSCILAS